MFKLNKNLKNSLFNILDSIFLPILAILVTPYFIEKLGIAEYGLWILINSIIASISIFNLGGAATIIKYVSHYRAKNDIRKINQVFGTSFIFQIFISLILFIISSLFVLTNKYHQLINSNPENLDTITYAIFLGTGILAIRNLEQLVIGYLKGYERFDLATIISIISKTVFLASQVLAVYQEQTLLGVFKYSLIAISIILTFQLILIKFYTNSSHLFLNFNYTILIKTISFSGWTWLLSASMIIATQMDKWIINLLADLEKLGYYSIGFLIFNHFHMILTSSLAWIFPKVSRERITTNTLKLFQNASDFAVVSSTALCIIALSFDSLFKIWLGQETYDNSIHYIQLLLAILPIYSLSIVPFFFLNANNLVRHNVYVVSATGGLRFVLMFFLYKEYQIEGIIFAFGLSSLFSVYYYLWLIKSKLDFLEIRNISYALPTAFFSLFVTLAVYKKVNDIILITLVSGFLFALYVLTYRNGFTMNIFREKYQAK